MTPSSTASLTIDLFCAVIDNFGDAGVCWRLARQLAREHGCAVRLWVDRCEVLEAIVPALVGATHCDGVKVGSWEDAEPAKPARLVIEAFACNPPASFVQRMAAARPSPLWINLEYLSAEDWVEGCHALPSPQANGLRKFFFFPGFTPATGGVIKENGLDAARRAFQASPAAQAAFWQGLGAAPQPDALRISLFAYENAAVAGLLDAWAGGDAPVFCAVPVGRVLPQVERWAGLPLAPGSVVARGALQLTVLPWLTQDDYDRLLWACDLNFVRGEDSFVRAQWAQRPFVWHIYQQDEDAHRIKLAAFLDRYAGGASAGPLRDFWQAWDVQQNAAGAWPALRQALPELKERAETWAERVASHGDLASKLLIFSKPLLE
ncbi:elongation factor P maturation arginine rhamnosyltransferase EarP [Viridibacterium curvum]|uniref:Protein-arginine rhamnosyltransferase n=1 Tax=Viridibacterium curvum TaxID=1101404 RepID=A0ABP9QNJ5_9RHOO